MSIKGKIAITGLVSLLMFGVLKGLTDLSAEDARVFLLVMVYVACIIIFVIAMVAIWEKRPANSTTAAKTPLTRQEKLTTLLYTRNKNRGKQRS